MSMLTPEPSPFQAPDLYQARGAQMMQMPAFRSPVAGPVGSQERGGIYPSLSPLEKLQLMGKSPGPRQESVVTPYCLPRIGGCSGMITRDLPSTACVLGLNQFSS